MTEQEAAQALSDAAALWSVGLRSHYEVVEAACDALVAGLDSQRLRELAGRMRAEALADVFDLLPLAMAELGLPSFARRSPEGRVAAATVMARRCLRGDIAPTGLADWAHRTFNHGQDEQIESLLGFSDEFDIAPASRDEPAIGADVLAFCRTLVFGTVS